ncbi:MAG: CheR family methyltransferase [Candidatus Hodarchaeota archaeon]
MIKITDKDLSSLDLYFKPLGIDVASLKKSHLRRRICMRLMRTGNKIVPDYIKYLTSNEEEQRELHLAFSINVTRFFRDIKVFEYIQTVLLREIQRNNPENLVKIWSAGCADGAEPYTLAILCTQLRLTHSNIKILATDFNNDSLNVAKKGIFPVSYLSETFPKFKVKYFINKNPDCVQVSSQLKELIEFKFNNLTNDNEYTPGSIFDLIVCRNVLIYFSNAQKEKLLKKFYKALKPEGFLVLGMAEILPIKYRDKFIIYNAVNRIYRKH